MSTQTLGTYEEYTGEMVCGRITGRAGQCVAKIARIRLFRFLLSTLASRDYKERSLPPLEVEYKPLWRP